MNGWSNGKMKKGRNEKSMSIQIQNEKFNYAVKNSFLVKSFKCTGKKYISFAFFIFEPGWTSAWKQQQTEHKYQMSYR